ncbi:MAG TPA: aldo/keto reductase, partial [Pseudonocardiaceae bacterium]
ARPQWVTEERLGKVERLAEWADKHDRTLLEVGIGALGAQPGCSSVIAGATSPTQVTANARAGDWIPTDEELAEIDGILAAPAG